MLDEKPLRVLLLGGDTAMRAVGEKTLVLSSSRVRKNDMWVITFETSGQRRRMYELVRTWIDLSAFLLQLRGLESIAKSHNSVVFRCQHRDDPMRRYALKRVHIARCRNELEVTERAITIPALQPYLARYVLMFEDSKDSSVTIVMRYYRGGSLSDRIHEVGSLGEPVARNVLSSLCCALYLLHANQILHLDVKAANILFDNRDARSFLNLKLVDFGSSVMMTEDHDDNEGNGKRLKTSGTYGCMAPERFDGQYGPESDVYGAGVVLYHMITGQLPFEGADSYQIMARNMQGDVSFASPRWRRVSGPLRALAARMLDKNPATRVTLPEILTMTWLFHDSGPTTECALPPLQHIAGRAKFA